MTHGIDGGRFRSSSIDMKWISVTTHTHSPSLDNDWNSKYTTGNVILLCLQIEHRKQSAIRFEFCQYSILTPPLVSNQPPPSPTQTMEQSRGRLKYKTTQLTGKGGRPLLVYHNKRKRFPLQLVLRFDHPHQPPPTSPGHGWIPSPVEN